VLEKIVQINDCPSFCKMLIWRSGLVELSFDAWPFYVVSGMILSIGDGAMFCAAICLKIEVLVIPSTCSIHPECLARGGGAAFHAVP